MSRQDGVRLRDVFKAHYFTGFLTCLGIYLFNYDTKLGKKLGWEQKLVSENKIRADVNGRALKGEMPFLDCRRPTEFLTGLTADIALCIVLICLL